MAWVELEPDFKPVALATADLVDLPLSDLVSMTFVERDRFKVFVTEAARRRFEQHMLAHRVETGGLLVGRVFEAPFGGRICFVEEAVPSDEFDGTGVSLVMGSSVWERARQSTTGAKGVIGWFHSHPNLGAFFSGTDRRTQRDFFSQPYSVGLVRDPIRKEEMWFRGPDSEPIGVDEIAQASSRPSPEGLVELPSASMAADRIEHAELPGPSDEGQGGERA